MDPAALGTARIGLDRIRREHEIYDNGDGSISRRPRRRPVGRLVAAALRAAAARLDPASTPARDAPAAASSL